MKIVLAYLHELGLKSEARRERGRSEIIFILLMKIYEQQWLAWVLNKFEMSLA